MEKQVESTLIAASLWKRILAYLFDGFLAIGLGLLFYFALGNYVLASSLGQTGATKNIYKYYVDSGLLYGEKDPNGEYTSSPSVFLYTASGEKDDSGSYIATPNQEYGYQAYLDLVWNYYTGFLAGNDERVVAMKKEDGTPYSQDDYYQYFNQTIIGLPSISDLADLSSDRKGEAKYFQYDLNEEGSAIDINAKPILQDNYLEKIANQETKETTLKELLSYFLAYDSSSSVSGLYYDAVMDLQGAREGSVQTYFTEQYTIISNASMVITFVCFLPFQFIFFFIIPLILKDGKTLGKLIFSLVVVRVDALRMKVMQQIIRSLILTLLGVILFALGTTIGVMLYMLLVVIDFCALSFSRFHQSLHDKACKTIVVDAKASVWFEEELAKEEYLASKGTKGNSSYQELEMLRKIAEEDAILDLSNIDRNRLEAKRMTSFDEFEKEKDAKYALSSKETTEIDLFEKDDAVSSEQNADK